MSAAPSTRRAAAEIEGQAAQYRINNRSIHQFWHLFAAQFRHVFLAPQRRPDSGRVAWTWREDAESRPVTATELTEVRRRLSEAARSLNRGFGDLDQGADAASGSESLDGQVRAAVSEMVAQLVAHRDAVLTAFVCRTDAGLMLHSWGASTAAKPFFPDSQNGEVSGSVILGSEPLSGVNIVLENAQGSVLMRTPSEKEGGFRFLHVAPGHYRVRAPDRSEFPVEGITVTMDRESITGLELRGAAPDSPEKGNPVVASSLSGDTAPWHGRKWIRLAALLGILGIGGCIWNSSRKSSEQTHLKNNDSGWQSAKGQLPGNEGRTGERDDRKVGADGAFSSLSDSLAPLKTGRPSRTPGDFNDKKKTGTETSPTDSTPEENRAANEADKTPEQKTNRKTDNVVSAPFKPTSAPSASPARGADAVKTGDAQANNNDSPGNEGSPLPGEKAAEGSPRTLGPKRSNQTSSNSVGANKPASTEPSDLTAAESKADPGRKEAETSPTDTTTKSRGRKNSVLPQNKTGAPSTASGTDQAQAESETAKGSPLNDTSGKTTPPQKTAGSSRPSGNPTPRSAADDETTTVPSTSPVESEVPDAGDQSSPSGNSPVKRGANPRSNGQAKGNETKSADNNSEHPEVNGGSDQKLGRLAGPSLKRNPASASAANRTTVPAVDEHVNASETVPNPDSTNPANSNPADKSAGKSSPNQSSASPPEMNPEVPKEPSAISPKITGIAGTKSDETELLLKGKVRGSLWKPRLVQDRIIPTRPLTAREEEEVDALRKKIAQERAAQMPSSFQSPHVSGGIVVEVEGESFSETEPLHWHDETGRAVAGASVRGRIAELEWPASDAPIGAEYMLSSRAGKTFARAIVDRSGFLVLKTAPATRVRCWVGIDAGPATDSSLRGFEWRQSTGEAIPASWKRDDEWRGGKGRRIEIPLDSTSIRVGRYGLSLVDFHSGWAISGDLTLQ